MQFVQNYRLDDQVIQLLTSSSDYLLVVKTQVILMDLLPSINKGYSLTIQEREITSF